MGRFRDEACQLTIYFTTADGLKFEFLFVNGTTVKQIWVTGRSINFGYRSNGPRFCNGHNWIYFK